MDTIETLLFDFLTNQKSKETLSTQVQTEIPNTTVSTKIVNDNQTTLKRKHQKYP